MTKKMGVECLLFGDPLKTQSLIVGNAFSVIGFYYYLLAYVHTVYVHKNTHRLAIDHHISAISGVRLRSLVEQASKTIGHFSILQ